MRHGGKILVNQLVIHGVTRVFSVPGESFLAALDGLYDVEIENVVCRHEGGAAMMAEAFGKLTKTVGVGFVTRGPGATNASAGLHVAQQDSTPMILFVGQIARAHRGFEAFQEMDYKAFFGSVAKEVFEIEETRDVADVVAMAFDIAQSGRPGPVVVSLPEDMLSGSADVEDAVMRDIDTIIPSVTELEKTRAILTDAKRPLVVVGGHHWSQTTAGQIAHFAKAQNLPVAAGFRRQDYMDNRHENYVGDLNVGINPALAKRLREADVLLVIGSRLGDIETSGYTNVLPEKTKQRIIHVHVEQHELGRVFDTELAIHSNPQSFVGELEKMEPIVGGWNEWTAAARKDYEDWITPQETPGDVKLEQVIAHLSNMLPHDAILTNGAGNYAAWLHRYYVFKKHGTQAAPTSGSMGYGFPAAISAKLQYPDRKVVCLAGDGCFQMTCNEFSTAMQHGANVVTIVVNNGRYGTIRMHQEKTYPKRVSGTMLASPDFAAFARAYGGYGETVTKTDDFAAAFDRAVAANLPAIIELKVDEQALSPSATLDQVRGT